MEVLMNGLDEGSKLAIDTKVLLLLALKKGLQMDKFKIVSSSIVSLRFSDL